MKTIRAILLMLLFPIQTMAVTSITLWHSMGSLQKQVLERIVDQFNHSQNEYRVIPIFKGDYSQSLTSMVAAFRAHQQPAIAQVYEVGTQLMINPEGIITPVYQLMQLIHGKLNANSYIPAVGGYYSDNQKRLLGMPFNSSAAILYYDKNAFIKAGLDPNKPPKTWPDVEEYSKKLLKAGYTCGFTTAYPSWTLIESYSAWHNEPLATENNGFDSLNTKLLINNPVVRKQFNALLRWQKSGVFRYGGRSDDAQALFTSETCPIFLESSGSLGDLRSVVSFPLGAGALPYWPSIEGAPQNAIIGGGALWALSGQSENTERGVATFFTFLSEPKIQAEWAQSTGYIPVTKAAYHYLQQQGYYKQHPEAEIAIHELNNKPPKPYTKGLRLGNYPQIRDIIEEEIENVVTGIKTPDAALSDASKQGNQLLKQYKENLE